MCCLFGFYNYSGKPLNFADALTNSLASEATARGTDATGISYVKNGKLTIYKKPKSAYFMNFKKLDECVSVLGHTRHATQGSKDKNYNNHPFMGYCLNTKFALAHNGVLFNDFALKKQYKLSDCKISTDSYIGVRLLEYFCELNTPNIARMCEELDGSFNFSIMDESNNLWLARGDNPLSIIHFPKYKLYVYASTDDILWRALVESMLFDELTTKDFEIIPIAEEEILKFTTDGNIARSKFKQKVYGYYGRSADWSSYGKAWAFDDEPIVNCLTVTKKEQEDAEKEYLDELKRMGAYIGYRPHEIDKLIADGFTLDEVADLLYSY